MAVPNPRDKHIDLNRDDQDRHGHTGSIIGILICFFVVASLGMGSFLKADNIIALSTKSSEIPKEQVTKPILQVKSPAPNSEIQRLNEIEVLKRSVVEWDSAINEVYARIQGYHEPMKHLQIEMQALQQSMNRLQTIGDVRGRNEIVYQYNEKSNKYNSLVADQVRLVNHQQLLIEGRNKLAREIHTISNRN